MAARVVGVEAHLDGVAETGGLHRPVTDALVEREQVARDPGDAFGDVEDLRFEPVGNALVALQTYPAWRGRLLAGVGHVPQMEAPARWLTEVADWYAAAMR